MEPGVYPDLEAAVSAARSISGPPPLSLKFSLCTMDVMADLHVPC
jgi:hypothetical protein